MGIRDFFSKDAREDRAADRSQRREVKQAARGTTRDEHGTPHCHCGAQMMPHPGVGYSCSCNGPGVFIPGDEIGGG